MFLALTGATSPALAPQPGEITVMNSAGLNYAGSLASDVQGYLAGLPSSDEEQLLDLIVPAVETNDYFQYAKADDEFYLTESDDSDIRAIGASFKKVQFRGTTVVDATQQKGLTYCVDHKTLPKVNGKIRPGWENRYAAELKNRLIRAEIVRALALLDAAAVNTGVVWSAAGNPDGDLRSAAQATRTAMGRMPTNLLLGNAAQQLRQDSYEAAARANHAMANHANYTMEELARYVGVKKVILEDGVQQSKKGAAKADRLGLAAYTYVTSDSVMMDDPSNIKRAWSPTPFDGRWAVAIKTGSVSTEITVFHESKLFVPFTTGVIKRTPAAA